MGYSAVRKGRAVMVQLGTFAISCSTLTKTLVPEEKTGSSNLLEFVAYNF